jgi:hypothetical protein
VRKVSVIVSGARFKGHHEDNMRIHFAPIVVIAAPIVFAWSLTRAADPTTADCLAATESSVKLGNEHKLRAERAQLLTCASANCPADIRKDCTSRVEEVNAQIPTVIFRAKDASGADITAVKVTMDGEVLADRLEGTALSIDPGEHTFTFETAGQSPVTKKLVIQQNQKDRAEVVTFGVATTAAGAPPIAEGTAVSSPDAGSGHGLGTQRILALVAGGIGVVGLGLGAAFGGVALSQKGSAQTACPGTTCASQAGASDWSSAASSGNISTISLIVGGVGVAGAAVLWFTAPSSSTGPSTQVGIGPGSIQLKGTW